VTTARQGFPAPPSPATMTRMDVPELYRRASAEFTARARRIGDRWEAPTPCPDWDVRELVHHLVDEERWAVPLFGGLTIEQVGSRLAGDLLGDDPLAALDEAATEATAAVAAEGAMDRTVHLSFGDVPGREYARQLAADHLVHAWDLARALGDDETLDADAVTQVRAWFSSMEQAYREMGVIGPRGPLPEGAGPQAELLAMFGRTP
jgi:uncharacterized protein (TIGR03086 family)